MRYKSTFILLLTGLLLISACSKEPIAPKGYFTATMVEQDGENSRNSRLFVAGPKYRVDMTLEAGPLTLIVDKSTREAYIISPAEKQYTKVTFENQMLVSRDPFLAVDYLKSRGQVSDDGQEMLNGYNCKKETLSFNNNPLLTQWIADTLEFPIKIENHVAANKFIELREIKRIVAEDSLFVVPADYKKLASRLEPTEPPPDWVKDLPKAQVIDTPFERTFAAGDMFRIPVRPETSVWIKAENIREGAADVRAIPFVNGHPVQPVDNYPNFAAEKTVCARVSETPREATEIVVRVFAGVVRLTGKGVATTQKLLEDGKVGILGLKPNLKLEEFRLVNTTPDTAVVSWNFYKDDEPMDEAKSRVPVSGRVTLGPYEVVHSSIDVPSERFHIRSERGDVLICLGQWDARKF